MGKRGRHCHCPSGGFDGRCRTLWGSDDSTVFKRHKRHKRHNRHKRHKRLKHLKSRKHLLLFQRHSRDLYARRPRKIGPTTSTHARVRAWTLQGKASNGIDIHWQATNAGMSAFRDDGGCGKHGGRGRICGASVGSVAVVASVACVASVAVVASVACVTSVGSVASVPRGAWGAWGAWGLRGAWGARKAYGFIRLVLIS